MDLKKKKHADLAEINSNDICEVVSNIILTHGRQTFER